MSTTLLETSKNESYKQSLQTWRPLAIQNFLSKQLKGARIGKHESTW